MANLHLSSADFVPTVPPQWQLRRGQEQPVNVQLQHWTQPIGPSELHHGDR